METLVVMLFAAPCFRSSPVQVIIDSFQQGVVDRYAIESRHVVGSPLDPNSKSSSPTTLVIPSHPSISALNPIRGTRRLGRPSPNDRQVHSRNGRKSPRVPREGGQTHRDGPASVLVRLVRWFALKKGIRYCELIIDLRERNDEQKLVDHIRTLDKSPMRVTKTKPTYTVGSFYQTDRQTDGLYFAHAPIIAGISFSWAS
ncbi:hypothetical protein B0T16DRAFT_212346 [Cercophora newfieldiana]|uniref:Uncharacterized protein n=1 Tax=Cercophora newfieldiana TaxID=92897 RepID=A0AA39XVX5_9PEZI|nr:hypothetical protein B0T16DRAFT_212346 [Cercophora newfieldiana]